MLDAARLEGQRVLADVTRAAVARLLSSGPSAISDADELFTDDERQQLADQLAATTATATLLGRARIRERADAGKFSDQADDFRRFDETGAGSLEPMTPQAAVDFFRRLVPTLNVDPERFGRLMERQAFTLAAATETILLERVQAAIADRLESGEVTDGPAAVQALLDDAGVGDNGPHYAEAVFRTNVMDAYNTGAQRELDDVSDSFPVWRYSNPDDGRSRPEHAARDGKYYPTSTPFTSVRGTSAADVIQCRCVPIPVHRLEWAELKQSGVRLERGTDPTDAEIAAKQPQPAPPGDAGATPARGAPKITPETVAAVADHFAGLLESARFQGFDFDRLKASTEAARALSKAQLADVAAAVDVPAAGAKSKEDLLRSISSRVADRHVALTRTGLTDLPAAPEGFDVAPLPELPKVEPPKAKDLPPAKPTGRGPAAAAAATPLPAELQPYAVALRDISGTLESLTYDDVDAAVTEIVGGLSADELQAVAGGLGVIGDTKADLIRGLKVALKAQKAAAGRTGLR